MLSINRYIMNFSNGKYPSLLLSQTSFFLDISFEIQVRYHTIHPFKVYSSVVSSRIGQLSPLVNFRIFLSP